MNATVDDPPVAARPFVKWAGGKKQILPELLARVPEHFGAYFEPFVGGGALFFALAAAGRLDPTRAALSDSNQRLIRTYVGVRDDVDTVMGTLAWYEQQHLAGGSDFYYRTRDVDYDAHPDDAQTAAWLIYLNKTGFNGLYRVNKLGKFNNPVGRLSNRSKQPVVCDPDNLTACSRILQGVTLECIDFVAAADVARAGDFVYFDPPYLPTSETSDFTSYTSDKFRRGDHEALRDLALELKSRGVHVLLSNSAAARELYEGHGFTIEEVAARRSINSTKTKRGPVTELLIR